MLYELDYRSYKQLVSEADTGLTVAVLLDKETKDKLIKRFAAIVQPYSRYWFIDWLWKYLKHY